jgi:hypothetical protein
LLRVFHRQAPRDGLEAAFRDHRNCGVRSGDRVIHQRRGDIDDASAGLLSQHLLDRELADEEKTFDIDGNERPQIVDRVIRECFEKYMPALLTSASIEPNLLLATSAIFAVVAASAMLPSTNARLSEASNAPDLVMFREFATTL